MIADLCLVLLLDASGSVDAAEWRMQVEATGTALASPAIVEKIVTGPHRNIVVTALEWSGAAVQMVPWTRVANADEAQAFASALTSFPRTQSGATLAGDALLAANAALLQAPACVRQVVDISSDGRNNGGAEPAEAVALMQMDGVQVNAIVIEDETGVLESYEQTVNGFALPATWENYAQAIKLKLSLEISALPPVRRLAGHGPWPASLSGQWREEFVYPYLASAQPVDEPGGAVLFGLALLGLGYAARGPK